MALEISLTSQNWKINVGEPICIYFYLLNRTYYLLFPRKSAD